MTSDDIDHTNTTTTSSSNVELVLSVPPMAATAGGGWIEDGDLTCRSCCQTATIQTDWAQGDRICTHCGVVHTGSLLDTRPEWREYENNDGDATTAKARCGMMPNNERQFVGGLPPTLLSKQVFGGNSGSSPTTVQHLVKAHRRIEKWMERKHKRALDNAEMNLQLLVQQRNNNDEEEEEDFPDGVRSTTDVEPNYGSNVVWMEERPELEQQILEQQEQYNIRQTALQQDKWSLERAKHWQDIQNDVDIVYQTAAKEMHSAHEMLMKASTRLKLPVTIAEEAATLLSTYCTKRDGFKVKGLGKEGKKKHAIPSLCASVLFWTARKRQKHRSLVEVCQQFQIQRKQCSKAMKELREHLPEAVASNLLDISPTDGGEPNAANEASVSSFVEHAVSKLNLPPVAESSVRCLVLHSYHHRRNNNTSSNNDKLSVLVAAVAYFCCSAGNTMQQLAANSARSRKRSPGKAVWNSLPDAKRIKPDPDTLSVEEPIRSKDDQNNSKGDAGETKVFDVLQESQEDSSVVAEQEKAYEMRRMWDAWTEQLPWARSVADIEQSIGGGLSRNVVWDFYKQQVFPQRGDLVRVLREASTVDPASTTNTPSESSDVMSKEQAILQKTPMASILLSKIAIAAPLLKVDRKIPK